MTSGPMKTGFDFREMPNLQRIGSWRPLDEAVARWVIAHGGSPLLAELAGWASYADGQGDSALSLAADAQGRHGMRSLDPEELAALSAQPMLTVLGPDGFEAETPFIIQNNHFYFRRNAMDEIMVAADLRIRRGRSVEPLAPCSPDDLRVLFDGNDSVAVQSQALAVTRVLGRSIFVLTGGPGTGKTTTVLRMLLALTREHHARHSRMPALHMAAPTGKAARNLADAMRRGAEDLQSHAEFKDSEWPFWLEPSMKAGVATIHRMLGTLGPQRGFRHHAGNVLDADIVVIDEASMLDLSLLRALLEAVPASAVLIFVGDAEQLPSVGAGSVFMDLVDALESEQAEEIVRLQYSFRADQALVPVNAALRAGDVHALAAASASAGPLMKSMSCATPARLQACIRQWQRDLRSAWDAAGVFSPFGEVPDARIFPVLRGRQLLCALREGIFGAEQVNARIERHFREAAGGAEWYPGRAIMIVRNDQASSLYNGDIGICLQTADGRLQVWFEAAPDAGGIPGLRAFAPEALPAHQGAFAITVHKSQGSEYGHVAVLLPPDADNAVLSRQLLYTAATRARKSLVLWSSEGVLQATLAARNARSSALPQRLL